MYDLHASQPNPINRSDASASVGTVPHDSENFRNSPNGTAPFRTAPNSSETEFSVGAVQAQVDVHRIPVREAARRFEAAGVARTERSIVNWCQPNPQGVARLDAYFDPNERRWLISQESLERAIAEERAKTVRLEVTPPEPEPLLNPEPRERGSSSTSESKGPDNAEGAQLQEIAELRREALDLRITNRAKDLFIEQLKEERADFIGQIRAASRSLGELETRLKLIDGGTTERDRS